MPENRRSETFTVYPAIDLRRGRVVRLEQGDPERQTTFGRDPVAVAARWLEAGATWLHVVNLDGAFAEGGEANWDLLPRLAESGALIQFGGGIRSPADMERAFASGVARVILGTVAIEQPELVAQAVAAYGPERVVVGIDARDGRVKTRGWQAEGGISAVALAQRMAGRGVTTAIHTDISRDGVLTGVNAAASATLAQKSGLRVIASGGVASLADVRAAAAYANQGVAGVITGRALYEGRLDLAEAIAAVSDIEAHDVPGETWEQKE